jgi:hypothetical protein
MRKHRRLEDRRLVLVIILFIVGVGGAAIALVYGWGLVGSALACLAAGAAIFGLLWLLLSLVERWVKNE